MEGHEIPMTALHHQGMFSPSFQQSTQQENCIMELHLWRLRSTGEGSYCPSLGLCSPRSLEGILFPPVYSVFSPSILPKFILYSPQVLVIFNCKGLTKVQFLNNHCLSLSSNRKILERKQGYTMRFRLSLGFHLQQLSQLSLKQEANSSDLQYVPAWSLVAVKK